MRCRCGPHTQVTRTPLFVFATNRRRRRHRMWRQPAGIRRCWLPSSAITSPPGPCSVVLAQGTTFRRRQGLTSRNAAYVMRTSVPAHPAARTSASDCGRWWIALRAYRPLNDLVHGDQVVHHLSAVESVLASRAAGRRAPRPRGSSCFWLPYPSFTCVRMCPRSASSSRRPLVLTALLQRLLSAVAQAASARRAV